MIAYTTFARRHPFRVEYKAQQKGILKFRLCGLAHWDLRTALYSQSDIFSAFVMKLVVRRCTGTSFGRKGDYPGRSRMFLLTTLF